MRANLTANSLVEVTGNNLNLVYLVLGVSLVALAIAFALRAQVLSSSEGTKKMQEIASAVQEGAAAYLARQFRTLSFFVVIVVGVAVIVERGAKEKVESNGLKYLSAYSLSDLGL